MQIHDVWSQYQCTWNPGSQEVSYRVWVFWGCERKPGFAVCGVGTDGRRSSDHLYSSYAVTLPAYGLCTSCLLSEASPACCKFILLQWFYCQSRLKRWTALSCARFKWFRIWHWKMETRGSQFIPSSALSSGTPVWHIYILEQTGCRFQVC